MDTHVFFLTLFITCAQKSIEEVLCSATISVVLKQLYLVYNTLTISEITLSHFHKLFIFFASFFFIAPLKL